jgi:hypothetical protein
MSYELFRAAWRPPFSFRKGQRNQDGYGWWKVKAQDSSELAAKWDRPLELGCLVDGTRLR